MFLIALIVVVPFLLRVVLVFFFFLVQRLRSLQSFMDIMCCVMFALYSFLLPIDARGVRELFARVISAIALCVREEEVGNEFCMLALILEHCFCRLFENRVISNKLDKKL
jgi:hypothetical protein